MFDGEKGLQVFCSLNGREPWLKCHHFSNCVIHGLSAFMGVDGCFMVFIGGDGC